MKRIDAAMEEKKERLKAEKAAKARGAEHKITTGAAEKEMNRTNGETADAEASVSPPSEEAGGDTQPDGTQSHGTTPEAPAASARARRMLTRRQKPN